MNINDKLNCIPTSNGYRTPEELIEDLTYISYASQIDYGMSHERAANLFGLTPEKAERWKFRYENKEYQNINTKN